MTTEIAKQQSFQERIKERIRESIGELITDEELSKIVHRAMEEVFFDPIVKEARWGAKQYEQPFIHKLLRELLEKDVRKAVDEYMSSNQGAIAKEVRSVVEQGIGQTVINALTYRFSNEMIDLEKKISESIKSL